MGIVGPRTVEEQPEAAGSARHRSDRGSGRSDPWGRRGRHSCGPREVEDASTVAPTVAVGQRLRLQMSALRAVANRLQAT
jgi:hypothetical protein